MPSNRTVMSAVSYWVSAAGAAVTRAATGVTMGTANAFLRAARWAVGDSAATRAHELAVLDRHALAATRAHEALAATRAHELAVMDRHATARDLRLVEDAYDVPLPDRHELNLTIDNLTDVLTRVNADQTPRPKFKGFTSLVPIVPEEEITGRFAVITKQGIVQVKVYDNSDPAALIAEYEKTRTLDNETTNITLSQLSWNASIVPIRGTVTKFYVGAKHMSDKFALRPSNYAGQIRAMCVLAARTHREDYNGDQIGKLTGYILYLNATDTAGCPFEAFDKKKNYMGAYNPSYDQTMSAGRCSIISILILHHQNSKKCITDFLNNKACVLPPMTYLMGGARIPLLYDNECWTNMSTNDLCYVQIDGLPISIYQVEYDEIDDGASDTDKTRPKTYTTIAGHDNSAFSLLRLVRGNESHYIGIHDRVLFFKNRTQKGTTIFCCTCRAHVPNHHYCSDAYTEYIFVPPKSTSPSQSFPFWYTAKDGLFSSSFDGYMTQRGDEIRQIVDLINAHGPMYDKMATHIRNNPYTMRATRFSKLMNANYACAHDTLGMCADCHDASMNAWKNPILYVHNMDLRIYIPMLNAIDYKVTMIGGISCIYEICVAHLTTGTCLHIRDSAHLLGCELVGDLAAAIKLHDTAMQRILGTSMHNYLTCGSQAWSAFTRANCLNEACNLQTLELLEKMFGTAISHITTRHYVGENIKLIDVNSQYPAIIASRPIMRECPVWGPPIIDEVMEDHWFVQFSGKWGCVDPYLNPFVSSNPNWGLNTTCVNALPLKDHVDLALALRLAVANGFIVTEVKLVGRGGSKVHNLVIEDLITERKKLPGCKLAANAIFGKSIQNDRNYKNSKAHPVKHRMSMDEIKAFEQMTDRARINKSTFFYNIDDELLIVEQTAPEITYRSVPWIGASTIAYARCQIYETHLWLTKNCTNYRPLHINTDSLMYVGDTYYNVSSKPGDFKLVSNTITEFCAISPRQYCYTDVHGTKVRYTGLLKNMHALVTIDMFRNAVLHGEEFEVTCDRTVYENFANRISEETRLMSCGECNVGKLDGVEVRMFR